MNKQPATNTVVVPNSKLAAALLKLPSTLVAAVLVVVIVLCLNLPDIPINLGVMTVSLPTLVATVIIPALLTAGRALGVNMSMVYKMVEQTGYTLPAEPGQPEPPQPAMDFAYYPSASAPPRPALHPLIVDKLDKARLTII